MKSRELELASFYLFFDIVILNIAILGMAWYETGHLLRNTPEISLYLLKGNLSALITFFIVPKKSSYLSDSFSKRVKLNTKRFIIFVLISLLSSLLVVKTYSYSYQFFFQYALLFFIGELMFHWLLYRYVRYKRSRGINTNHALIIGINPTSCILRKAIESDLLMGYKFVGFLDDAQTDYPEWIGYPDDLESILNKQNIEIIFVTISTVFCSESKLAEYLRVCNTTGVHLRLIFENSRWFHSNYNLETYDRLEIINPQKVPMDDSWARISKRLFDIAFSLLVILLIFSWLFPIVALLIKLNSKGPVFFIQKRTGINNRIFNCFKFRSMYVNGLSDSKQATKGDSRITPIGRFMRKTNIDELPQFFNVLRGDMSVVGPRPHMLKHTDEFSELIKFYLVRHYVRPGITGWAQVNGYRGITDERWKLEKRVEYDMKYVENWSLWWDIKIIIMTIFDKRIYYNAG